jgi:hypothetical protein
MVDSSDKLANDHAQNAHSFRLANQTPELFEHGVQTGTGADLESLACKLIELFAQGSASQPAVSPSSAVLQAADEMEMAELNDPALGGAELDNSRNLVGDRGLDASVYVGRDRCEDLRPALHILSARQQHRVEEDGSILMARLDCHHIQDPVFSSKAKVKPIQNQNQGASWHAQNTRSRYEVSQASTKTPTQALMGKAVAWRQSFQRAATEQYCFENSRTRSPRLAAAAFLADSPRPLALTALTTSSTEVINFRLATRRFRVPRMHARELDTDYRSKYPKTQLNSA